MQKISKDDLTSSLNFDTILLKIHNFATHNVSTEVNRVEIIAELLRPSTKFFKSPQDRSKITLESLQFWF